MQAPDEKIVDEVARAIKDHQAGIAWGKESSCKRAAIAALAAARPLLEAEIRKDEREKVLREMFKEASRKDRSEDGAPVGFYPYDSVQPRVFINAYASDTHNLDLTTDSKNGEG